METMNYGAGDSRGYEPFEMRPLRMRGVFGAAWQIYKRGFWGMLLLTFLLVGIWSGLTILIQLNSIEAIENISAIGGGMDDRAMLSVVGGVFSGLGVAFLLSAIGSFLLAPMYAGTANAEYARRMRGGVSTGKALLRSCGVGLKRYYVTYLAMMLTQFGINFVVGILVWVMLAFGVLGMVASGMMTGSMDVGTAVGLGLLCLLVFFVLMMANIFLGFTYPVAVNENKLHFRAIGRSIALVGKRFWRVLWANVLAGLIVGAVSLPLVIPGTIAMINGGEQMADGMLILSLGMLLGALLTSPYLLALNHALYYDAASREADRPFDPHMPIPEDVQEAPKDNSPQENPPQYAPVQPTQDAPQPVIPQGARFDPYTGEPLCPPPAPPYRFDPQTGEPLVKPEEPQGPEGV